MHKITLITPPDKIFNSDYTFLLIYPKDDVKQQFLRSISYVDLPLTVYEYEKDALEHDVDWLLSVCKLADIVIFDIDNTPPEIREIAGYIISNSNTYWLTNSTTSYYNKLSVNRVYNLDFIQQKLGEYIETQTQ